MKDYLFISGGALGALITLVFGLFLGLSIVSCNYTSPISSSCTEFDASCELMKPWAAVKVVNFVDTGVVDVYGEKVKLGVWYLRNQKTTMFLPMPAKNPDRPSLNSNEWFENSLTENDPANIKADTIRIMIGQGDSRKTADVAIFCIKNGQIELRDDISHYDSFCVSFYKKE